MSTPPEMDRIYVRRMQLVDVEKILEIDQLSFSMPWPASAYNYELRENLSSLLWLAEVELPDGNRQIAGMIVVWMILDEAHIATIAVHPDQRRKGIGQRLLATGLQEAIRKGARQATLEVRAGNLTAQKLYQRFRFEVAGQRLRYYRDNNEDALIMTVNHLDETYLEWLERHGQEKEAPKNDPGGAA